MSRGELKCKLFEYLNNLLDWVNSHDDIEIVSITMGTSNYLLFYREIDKEEVI